ncbi:MAG: DUF4011 domain-containing protein, partial [Lentisphaeria bacterium]|nr:DUF4011 domain-containing protein [Lentisphaeria bacterium]
MPESETESENTPKVFSAELLFVSHFNLALQQNALPVAYALKLCNGTEHPLEHLECRVTTVPEFILEKKWQVSDLKEGEELVLDKLGLELNYTLLSELSESMKGKLDLEILSHGEVIFRKEYDCEAFAPDQWLGMKIMPELLASFVTPNLDAVIRLQSAAAGELERATGSSAILGYQADKKHVYEVCAAIYRAIHAWGIQYSNPAASFGTPGQRIRFADAIYQYKLATCLDTALLFASVMEGCGLHPVIMVQKGHAYVGCHLKERYFSDIPMDDLQAIRKLADLDEFLVIETTMVTGNATFAEAEAAARSRHLNIDDEFVFAIDILRARYSGINPLPLKKSVNGAEFAPVERKGARQEAEETRTLEGEVDLSRLSTESALPSRVVRWTQKLLDLSLRNRLLNVRDTKFVIPIACTDITVLEDKIAANESLTLGSLPDLLGEKDLHDLSMLRNSDVKTNMDLLLEHELSQQRLWTPLAPTEMYRRLTALYRQGKTDLEEGGVNTLYLAIGFIEWKVSERDEKSYLAPILLLPVRLQRKSIVEGIRITRVDGETLVNETLLELLRSQYHLTVPGLSPLPTDESGVDVKLVMQIFRQSVKEMKGWEVREEARIGHFSFGKFVMWTDLTARLDILVKNPIIAHLISGGGLFDDGIEVFPPEEIEAHLDLSKLFCPLSADSSQLAAVLYSQMGKSFVLHGPPGTGKSQTITNIIAHNLALGKRVLFVSEKKAALDVVHKRLSQIGLKPFCLELHSNKSGKTEVLSQFNEALLLAETGIPSEWESTIASLDFLRSELDGYVRELHHGFPNGFSAYDCFSHFLSRKEGTNAPAVTLEADLLAQSREEYEDGKQKFTALAECGRRIRPESAKTFDELDLLQWSPVLENDLLSTAKNLLESIENLRRKFAPAAELFSLPEQHEKKGFYDAATLLQTIKDCEDTPGTFFCGGFQEKALFLSSFCDNALNYLSLKAKLQNYRLETFPDFDFPGIARRVEKNESSFFLLKFFANASLLRELAVLKKSGGVKLSLPELKALLPDAEAYVRCFQEYEKGRNRASILLAEQWKGGEVDWELLKRKIGNALAVLQQLNEIVCPGDEAEEKVLNQLESIMPDISRRCARGTPMRQEINAFLEAWNRLQETVESFGRFSRILAGQEDLETLERSLRRIVENIPDLRNALLYRNLRREVSHAGLGNMVSVLESSPPGTDGTTLFDDMFFQTMLDQILKRSPLLCGFSGAVQEERIKKFRQFDAKYMNLTRKVIFARLAANLPRRRSGPCPDGTELGILKRECEKRARQKPVRLLLEQIPTLAPLLKPCFLMSPLSVAQYLPADSAPFDLIVFDEASQIPVWDAIGVIARGKQLIVVGDPKQMPPTNFFQKGENEEDDTVEEETKDLESILDECIVAGLHSTYLNWHYRSRHESLIAFSNHHYYDARLCTFPSARNTEKLGIRFQFVPDGVYDRKNSRTNRKEAEALVRYIFDRLRRAAGKYRSIGVVTFSQAQKDLIEDLVEKERKFHPELETCFDDSGEEPLFVKNLENVQGDERDVILFSVGYAPDAEGRFSMNFGPLNRQGGERRLNVAITRAKEQIVVFSSIHADRIDLARTNAVGAAHLKYFLEYAEKRNRISSAGTSEGTANKSCDSIADFLAEKGFQVERNVGCSRFRIDLAVCDPDHPGDYLLGIEYDNASYAAQNTTRDREELRRQILEGLSWHIYRIWSVDWVFDRKRAEKELLEYIEKIGNDSSEEPEQTQVQEEEIPAAEENASALPAAPQCSENRKEY